MREDETKQVVALAEECGRLRSQLAEAEEAIRGVDDIIHPDHDHPNDYYISGEDYGKWIERPAVKRVLERKP